MALSFITIDNEAITYKGVVNGKKSFLHRYVQDEMPTTVELVKCVDVPHDICMLLAMIPEFKDTARVFVELQVNMHSAGILKLEGVIIGFLIGRYTRMNVESCSSIKRTSFATKFVTEKGQSPIRIVGSPPKTKHNTMYMVGHLYPGFYNYMLEFVKSDEFCIGKMDDVCDTLAYAYMAKVL
jgi:hypothetical protein